jgi:hypothetical protein
MSIHDKVDVLRMVQSQKRLYEENLLTTIILNRASFAFRIFIRGLELNHDFTQTRPKGE